MWMAIFGDRDGTTDVGMGYPDDGAGWLYRFPGQPANGLSGELLLRVAGK